MAEFQLLNGINPNESTPHQNLFSTPLPGPSDHNGDEDEDDDEWEYEYSETETEVRRLLRLLLPV